MASDRNIRDQRETHIGLPGPWRQNQLDFLWRISVDEKKAARIEEIISDEHYPSLIETSRNFQWWQGTAKRFKWVIVYGGAAATLLTMVVKFFRDQLPHSHP